MTSKESPRTPSREETLAISAEAYEEFLKAPPQTAPRSAPQLARGELVASRARFFLVFTVLTTLGYFVSLSVCEQHNIGFFVLSQWVAEWIEGLPPLVCAGVCGAIFTGIPHLTAIVFLNGFQRRFLLFRLSWVALSVPLVAVACLYGVLNLPGGHGFAHRDPTWMTAWTLVAIATPFVLELLDYLLFLRPRNAPLA